MSGQAVNADCGALLALSAASTASETTSQPEANQRAPAARNWSDYWMNGFTGTPAPISTS